MKNPLLKRLPKELIQDWGKYLVIFLFMTLTIGFVSGFLVTDLSMQKAYSDSFQKNHIEDGNFSLLEPITGELKESLEKQHITIYNNIYVQEDVLKDQTLRIYKNRHEVNLPSIMEGVLPKGKNEIAIDRLYAKHNELEVGSTIHIADRDWKISGLVALPDYSALFKNNTDFMFDAQKFGVAIVSPDDFSKFEKNNQTYNYVWKYDDNTLTADEKIERADTIRETIVKQAVLTNFITEADNQGIHFTGEDMGSDLVMITWLLYIVIVIMAFVFAVTVHNTIESEAAVIGTLRASGYTRGELLLHYLMLPISVTVISAVIGNVLGYTVFKGIVVELYYGSYSLPPYKTLWNGQAFLMTTVIPSLIMLLVNIIILSRQLKCTPLQFLRRDLKKHKGKRAIRLHRFQFFTRFRMRIVLQNIPSYICMLVGILFANVLLMFGLLFAPLLTHYEAEIQDSMICNEQYILKAPVETTDSDAEKYQVSNLEFLPTGNQSGEEITVYGIEKNSKYLKDIFLGMDKNGVIISSGLMEKYGLEAGDTITAENSDNHRKYKMKIAGSYQYPATLSIFMTRDAYNERFGEDEEYFNGYFSNGKLSDIDDAYVASIITEADMTNMVKQLESSLGVSFYMFSIFSLLLSSMLIYLLSKLVIEKNRKAISMVKILGYHDKEIGRLYIMATALIVIVSELISLPVAYFIIHAIYFEMMKDFAGWLTFYIKPDIYLYTFLCGVLSYAVVTVFQYRKIRKIPKEDALKDSE